MISSRWNNTPKDVDRICVTKDCTIKILEQMQKSICKIKMNDSNFGNGFFCKIPFEDTFLKVIITSNKLVNKKNFHKIKNISLDNGEIEYMLNKDENRIIYSCNNDNITIIEIKENLDNKENKDIIFLDLDSRIKIDNQFNYNYEKIESYIIQYNKNEEISVSHGYIQNINNDQINFVCPLDKECIGFPIFNLSDNKVIGIYKDSNNYYKFGTILTHAINEYKSKYINNKKKENNKKEITKNIINIKIYVDEDDFNNGDEIYFLDNTNYYDKDGKQHSHENLKELEKLHPSICIDDGDELEFIKCFVFTKGIHNIILEFDNNLTDCSYMFAGCKNIINIDFISFDTKKVTNMEYMFSGCSNLTELDLSNFDTSNVINMEGMFGVNSIYKNDEEKDINDFIINDCCKKLKKINLYSFNTSKVKNMCGMFYSCISLIELDLISFYINSSTNISFMFFNCKKLRKISVYLKNNCFNTFGIFTGCEKLNNKNDFENNIIGINKDDNEEYIHQKFKDILKLYQRMDIKYINYLIEDSCSILMKYKTNKKHQIQIFGENPKGDCFLKSEINKKMCRLIYNNREYQIQKTIKITDSIKEYVEIKLLGINHIKNASYMFSNCVDLIELPDINKWYTKKVTDINHMFNECSSLTSLPDISHWNTNEVINMSYLFSKCSSLVSIPDISNWNTDKVTDMSFLFQECSLISSLPDISNWNLSNVTNIEKMFYKCQKLSYFPENISNWDISKVSNMSYLFSNCTKVLILPNISNWDTKNVTNMSGLFDFCTSLMELHDISKWKTDKVKLMSRMFYFCTSLECLPDISKWNVENVTNMNEMFTRCSSLISLPDISKWETINVTNMSDMFKECRKLESLPDLNKWKTINLTNKNGMFELCRHGLNIPPKFK